MPRSSPGGLGAGGIDRCITLGILSTPASDVYERLKTNGKAMKITLLRLPTINKEVQFGRTKILIHENK